MTNIEALDHVGELASARLAAATARSVEDRERWEKRVAELDAEIDLRPGHTVVVIESPPDNLGRQRFTVYWWGYIPGIGDGVRGQNFHARADEHVARWQARGERIEIREADDGREAP